MNIAAMTLAAVSLAAAASTAAAAAPSPASDMDYLKASRCRGIAAGMGADAAGLDAYLKAQGVVRAPNILERGEQERDHAKRQARGGEGKERLAAELAGPCIAYMAPAKAVAAR
ncbi:MAG: hypothetical protein JWQ97_1764 [Phenylobacterium sp.]|nr:hypothetical protein [Phenylobacterium sp.]